MRAIGYEPATSDEVLEIWRTDGKKELIWEWGTGEIVGDNMSVTIGEGSLRMRKEVTHRSTGLNQLGHTIGLPQEGDEHKVHVRGFYRARRPKFELLGKKYFEKMRRIQFLDTHMVGDTAFVCVHVGAESHDISSSILSKGGGKKANDGAGGTLGELIQTAASGMVLGEAARFTYDISDASESQKMSLFRDKNRICRGHFDSVKDDATSIILEVDSFRIMRNGKENCRKRRNDGSRVAAMY